MFVFVLTELLVIVALGVSLYAGLAMEKVKRIFIPVQIGHIAVGVIAGAIARFVPAAHGADSLTAAVRYTPTLFHTVLIPFIVFEMGWSTFETKRILFHNLGTVFLFSSLGTVISTGMITGILVIVNVIFNVHNINVLELVLLAALLSAIDPVSTLTAMTKLKGHPILHSIIFGEGVLSNAMSVILFRTTLEIYLKKEELNAGVIAGTVILNILASPAIGVGVALIGSVIVKHSHLKKHPVVELSLCLIFGLFTFMLAEILHMPGDVAIFFFGIVSRHYMWYNLSSVAREHTDILYSTLREIMEMLIFVLLGAQIFVFDLQDYNALLIITSFVACVVSRGFLVFSLSCVANIFRHGDNRMERNMQIMMWFSGLRGAVAYSLAMSLRYEFDEAGHTPVNSTAINQTIPLNNTEGHHDDTTGRFNVGDISFSFVDKVNDSNKIITTTHSIIVLTVLIFGLSAGPLLNFLELTGDDFDHSTTILTTVKLRVKPLETFWRRIDKSYMIPVFSTPEKRLNKIAKSTTRFRRNTELYNPGVLAKSLEEQNLVELGANSEQA